ncbi:MAG TPA: phage major capsid protein [Terracidiphilus sp.]|nr:phage major capsid protein [Terracidiphilus sp.]
MTKAELQLKRGQLGTEAHRLLTQPNLTPAQRAEANTKAAAMMDEADGITEQLALLERSDRNSQIVPGSRPQPGAGNGEIDDDQRSDEEQDRQYRSAFEVYMRGGMLALRDSERTLLSRGQRTLGKNVVNINGEKRDLTIAGTGNFIVPQQFYNELVGAKKYAGAFLQNVRRKTTAGNGAPMKIGLENDTANTIVVVAENTTVTEADPTLSGFVSSTDTLATLIKVSKQELADSAFDLQALFRDRLGKRYQRGIENFIANGDAGNIQAITAAATSFSTSAVASAVGYPDFVACEALLDIAYEPNAKWAMSKATRNYVMGLLDTLNRPLFLPNPQTGMLDEIIGYPIVLTPYLPAANASNVLGILFGDFEEGYLLRDDGEMTIQRLDERYADQLMVGFIAYTRIGGNVTDAGTHPIVGLKTHV